MRRTVLACISAFCTSATLTNPAAAGTRVEVRTQSYDISGETGRALLEAMDRKGPKHGFTARAIAQTSYTVDWQFTTAQNDGGCRMKGVSGKLNLTYTYPRVVSPLAPALRKRWSRFFAGVRAHEQDHGRMAREMVNKAARAASVVKVANDPLCTKVKREAKRRIDAIYAAYEARQIAFDQREHRKGGHVEALVVRLVSSGI